MALRELVSGRMSSTTVDATVADAAETMARHRVGSAVVLVGESLMGIFTERDVLRAAASHADLNTEKVRDWMTPDPITAMLDDDSADASERMLAGGFRHLPVVDERGKLVGVVSLRDLLSTRIRKA